MDQVAGDGVSLTWYCLVDEYLYLSEQVHLWRRSVHRNSLSKSPNW